MNSIDFLNEFCICGHLFMKHYGRPADGQTNNFPAVSKSCADTIEMHHNGTYYTFCKCESFVLDNLRYLEMRSYGR